MTEKIYAWSVHLFTSLGAVFAVLAIIFSIDASNSKVLGDVASFHHNIQYSIYCILLTVFIDSVDGTLARKVDIKKIAPLDGALLDNIIDFTTYCIIPCVWVFVTNIVSEFWVIPIIVMITISSSYQFCQPNAKTNDHFFVGFPSYWNVIIIAMLCFQTNQELNIFVLILLSIFSFIPIKYIYLSRVDNISSSSFIRKATLLFAIINSVFFIYAVFLYPQRTPNFIQIFIYIFVAFYILYSFKLNLFPIVKNK